MEKQITSAPLLFCKRDSPFFAIASTLLPTNRAQCAALPLYSERGRGTVIRVTGPAAADTAASITGWASLQSGHHETPSALCAPVNSASTAAPLPECAAMAASKEGPSVAVTWVAMLRG